MSNFLQASADFSRSRVAPAVAVVDSVGMSKHAVLPPTLRRSDQRWPSVVLRQHVPISANSQQQGQGQAHFLDAAGHCYCTQPFRHQAAGHRSVAGTLVRLASCTQCISPAESGSPLLVALHFSVLKPLPPGRKGEVELAFYEHMQRQRPQQQQCSELWEFVPVLRGVVVLKMLPLPAKQSSCGQKEEQVTYLQLEDQTAEFSQPHVLDVKIGRFTYDPFATGKSMVCQPASHRLTQLFGVVDKIVREHSKCTYQNSLGFRLCGLKVSWDGPLVPVPPFTHVCMVRRRTLPNSGRSSGHRSALFTRSCANT